MLFDISSHMLRLHLNIASVAFFMLLFLAQSVQGEGEPAHSCKVVPPTEPGRVGAPVLVEYQVRWPSGESCAVFPLTVDDPAWGTARLVSSRMEQDGDQMVSTQTVEYTAGTPGTHALPPVKIPLACGTLPPVGRFEQAPSEYLEAPSTSITVRSDLAGKMLVWGAPFAGLVVALAAIGLFYRGRKKASAADKEDVVDFAGLVHAARRHRLDGNFYACYRQLLDLCRLLSDHTPAAVEIASRLERRVQEVGFGGVRPPEDEVEGFFRDLERLTAQMPKISHDTKENLS